MYQELIAYLEELEDLRKPAQLRFLGDQGGVASLNARMIRLQKKEGAPGLLADGIIYIPLTRLLSVNNMQAKAFT